MAPAATSCATMHQRLRSATQALHERVEQQVDLTTTHATRERYVWFLSKLLGFHHSFEPLALAAVRANGCDAVIAKAPLLAADLTLLGAPQPTSAPEAELPSLVHALGAAYVLEGATLGGRVLCRSLAAQEWFAAIGVHHYLSAFERTSGAGWNKFMLVVENYAQDERTSAAVVDGAIHTFARLSVWLDDGS